MTNITRTTNERPSRIVLAPRSSRRNPGAIFPRRPVSLAAAFLALCLSALLLFGPPSAVASPSDALPGVTMTATQAHTQHYDVYSEGPDANDLGAMLEQLHAQLQTYFGTAPQQRLSVGLYATRARWAEALQADGQYVPAQAGGYYAPQVRKAYAWIQPTAYFTRHLVLHEATHQFHWLTTTNNQDPGSTWYTEGLAEYFGMHNWDGQHLQTGIVPAVTLEDYPATALTEFDASGDDISRLFDNNTAGRPESWALVHFLLDRHPDQFHQLAKLLDKGQDSPHAFSQVFGKDLSQLSVQCRQWILTHTQPWQVVWTGWQQRGDSLEGDSATVALTLLKEAATTLTAEVTPLTAGGKAGLVFAYKSSADFHLFQILGVGKVAVIHRQNGAWTSVMEKDFKPATGANVLSVAQAGSSTTLQINGEPIATVAATGTLGLDSNACRATFRVLQPTGL